MSRSARLHSRTPEAGLAAAEEAVQVADATANPTARSMGRYALGLVLKKSEPDRALAIRRSGGAGRLGPELLVARHRVDGGGYDLGVHGDPARAAAISSKSSITGTEWAIGASRG